MTDTQLTWTYDGDKKLYRSDNVFDPTFFGGWFDISKGDKFWSLNYIDSWTTGISTYITVVSIQPYENFAVNQLKEYSQQIINNRKI